MKARRVVFFLTYVLRTATEPAWTQIHSETCTPEQAREIALRLATARPPDWKHLDAVGHLVLAQEVPRHLLADTTIIGRAGVRWAWRTRTTKPVTWASGSGIELPKYPVEPGCTRVIRELPTRYRLPTRRGTYPWFGFKPLSGCLHDRTRAAQQTVVAQLEQEGLLERHPTQRRWRITPAMLQATKEPT